MISYQNQGRALQLEGLENARNKVTIGFKCEPLTKIELAQEAHQSGLTLSEYVETIVSLRHSQGVENSSQLKYANENIQLLEKQVYSLHNDLDMHKTQLSFYEEDPIMLQLFERYAGHIFNYRTPQGILKTLRIEQVMDIFTILINSFIPQKQ